MKDIAKKAIFENGIKFILSGLIFVTAFAYESHAGKRKRVIHSNYSDFRKNTCLSGPKISGNFKILDSSEAENIFDTIQNMADIPFGYFKDGCFARAHEVADRLHQDGIESKKVWILAGSSPILSDKYPQARWMHHVAPLIPVSDSQGKTTWQVLDPTLLTHIAPIQEWLETMKLPMGYELVYSSRSEYVRSDLMFGASSDEALEDLNYARAVNEEHLKILSGEQDSCPGVCS